MELHFLGTSKDVSKLNSGYGGSSIYATFPAFSVILTSLVSKNFQNLF